MTLIMDMCGTPVTRGNHISLDIRNDPQIIPDKNNAPAAHTRQIKLAIMASLKKSFLGRPLALAGTPADHSLATFRFDY